MQHYTIFAQYSHPKASGRLAGEYKISKCHIATRPICNNTVLYTISVSMFQQNLLWYVIPCEAFSLGELHYISVLITIIPGLYYFALLLFLSTNGIYPVCSIECQGYQTFIIVID